MARYQVTIRLVIHGTATIVLPEGSTPEEVEEAGKKLRFRRLTDPQSGTVVDVNDAELEVI
jgi:hypothetical protein